MFNKKNFSILTSSAKSCPKIYCYFHEGAGNITDAGFLPVNIGLLEDDIVMAYTTTSAPKYYKVQILESKLKLVLLS